MLKEPGNKENPTDEQARCFAEHMDAMFHFFIVGDYRDAASVLLNNLRPALDEIGDFDSQAAALEVAASYAQMDPALLRAIAED